MNVSELFNWAEKEVSDYSYLKPNEFIYLLFGCLDIAKRFIGEPMTPVLLDRMRLDLIQYITDQYLKGIHSCNKYDYILDHLILPHLQIKYGSDTHYFYELKDRFL